jgi:hypothetical protein
VALAPGQAETRDFITTLEVELDLSAAAAGDYRLAVRRSGESWALYPAAVR